MTRKDSISKIEAVATASTTQVDMQIILHFKQMGRARRPIHILCVVTDTVLFSLQLPLSPSRQASYKLASRRFHLYTSLLPPCHLDTLYPYTPLSLSNIQGFQGCVNQRLSEKRILTPCRSFLVKTCADRTRVRISGTKEEDSRPFVIKLWPQHSMTRRREPVLFPLIFQGLITY